MKQLIQILALCVFPLACCNAEPIAGNLPVNIPVELRHIINENRNAAFPSPHPDIGDIIASFTPANIEGDARVAGILRQKHRMKDVEHPQNISATVNLETFLTHEELGEDTRFLFDILRHGYGGYWYFGGDGIFFRVRDLTLERLAGMDNPLQVSSYLNDLILPALRGVIADNHFHIHDNRFWALRPLIYMNEEFIIRKSETGFVTEIDGVIYNVLKATPVSAPFLDGVLPTLTQEGEFAYAFGVVTQAVYSHVMKMTVLFENPETGESHSRIIDLPRVISRRQSAHPELLAHETGGVTILENKSLENQETEGLLKTFFQSGYALRDKPVLVLDLRGNRGGYELFAREWVRGYTGHPPAGSLFSAESGNLSMTASELRMPLSTKFNNNEITVLKDTIPEDIADFLRESGFGYYVDLSLVYMNAPVLLPIPNKNLVVVLIDNNVASAGESFVGYLRQLENVLVVGTNTSGTFLTSGMVRTNLPYSNLGIRFGTELNLRPDLSQFEGIGFMPDLWVPPEESLKRVLRFVERYRLSGNN